MVNSINSFVEENKLEEKQMQYKLTQGNVLYQICFSSYATKKFMWKW